MTTRFENVMAEMEKVAAKAPAALAGKIRSAIAERRTAEDERVLLLAARESAATDRSMRVKARMAEINRQIAELELKTAAGKKGGADAAAAAALAKRTGELLAEIGRLRAERDRDEKLAHERAAAEDAAWQSKAAQWAAEDAKVLHGR